LKNLTFLLLVLSNFLSSQVVINEFVASNYNNFYDEDNDDPDWIELYNSSDKAVNLKGWKIFDKNEIENAFVLPDTILQAKERIVIFASGKNRYTSNKLYVETTGMGIAGHLKDEIFHFKYLKVDTDFTAELKIDNMTSSRFFAGTGIMFKEKLDSKSRFAAIVSNNVRDSYSGYYKYSEDEFPKFYQSDFLTYPYLKVKLVKIGNEIEQFILAYDRVSWYSIGKDSIEFDNGYLGVCFAASDYTNTERDNFLVSDFKIDDMNVPIQSLTSIDISPVNLNSISKLNNEIHTNFSLSKSKGELFLWDNNENIIDQVSYDEQLSNISYSRYPELSNNFVFSSPTPNSSNTFSFNKILDPPYFSDKSVFGETLSKIEINHNEPNVEIYYTLDGSLPTKESYYYQNQIILDTAVVIRAKAFLDGFYCKNDVSFSYLPDEKSKLSIMSLVLDEKIFYDEEEGLFLEDNIFKNFELPVHFNYYFSEGNSIYSSFAGLKLHGQASRNYKQKSFRISARSIYNNDNFDFPFWGSSASNKSEKFILRNGGQDRIFTFIRDYFANVLVEKSFDNIDYNASKLIITYLNNNYYGLHVLKERFDDNYVKEKYNVNSSSVNILKDDRIHDNGDCIDYIESHKLIINENDINIAYNLFQDKFDLESFCEYTLFEFYSAEEDWPINNQIVWSSNEFDGKWRWHINDFDLSFDYPFSHSSADKDMLPHIKTKGGRYADLLIKLLDNDDFVKHIGNIFADKLNSKLKAENTKSILDSLSNLIKPELDRHNALYDDNLSEYDFRLKHINEFLEQRVEHMFINSTIMFNQSGTTDIHLSQNIENAGVFHLNSLEISDESWTGTYFNEIPISISVKSNPGYRFIGWQDIENKDSILSDILITEYNKFHAVFEKTGDPINNKNRHLVINEIMYKAKDNMKCGDWIELYNNNNNDVDLYNWIIQDKKLENTYTIPENTIIKKYDYLIIAQDILDFKSYYGISNNIVGDFDFGFGESDLIKLFDNSYNLIDKVEYSNKNPWDINADGTGYSLELIHHNYDNSLPWNWKASISYSGTPLESNSTFITEVESTNEAVSIYPNPVIDFLTIELKDNTFSKVKVFDLLGNELFSNSYSNSIINLDFNEYSSAIYVIRIYDSNNNIILNTKIIKK
jgi:hypothetical protein